VTLQRKTAARILLTIIVDRIRAVRQRVEARKNKNQSTSHKRDFSTALQVSTDVRGDDKRLRADDVPYHSLQAPGTLTDTNSIRLMGSLELPHPRDTDLDEIRVQHVLNLMPHLQKLDDRNLQGKLFSDDS
jgi:hypothetical protein